MSNEECVYPRLKREEKKSSCVTDKMRQQMKELREEGLSYSEIGRRFGVSSTTVTYNTDEKKREEMLARSNKRNTERYHTDPEFKERMIKDAAINYKLHSLREGWNCYNSCRQKKWIKSKRR